MAEHCTLNNEGYRIGVANDSGGCEKFSRRQVAFRRAKNVLCDMVISCFCAPTIVGEIDKRSPAFIHYKWNS